jgi:hypothetical protein
MKTTYAFLLLAALAAAGCGSEDSSSNELEGVWSGQCKPDEPVGGGPVDSSTRVRFLVSGKSGAFHIEAFDSADCTGSLAAFTNVQYNLGGTRQADAPDGAKELDFTLGKATTVAHTDDRVSFANASSACGYTDWLKDLPQTINGRDCFAVGIPGEVTAAVDTPFFDIYQITGSTLCFGSPHAAWEPVDRPTALLTGDDCLSK